MEDVPWPNMDDELDAVEAAALVDPNWGRLPTEGVFVWPKLNVDPELADVDFAAVDPKANDGVDPLFAEPVAPKPMPEDC